MEGSPWGAQALGEAGRWLVPALAGAAAVLAVILLRDHPAGASPTADPATPLGQTVVQPAVDAIDAVAPDPPEPATPAALPTRPEAGPARADPPAATRAIGSAPVTPALATQEPAVAEPTATPTAGGTRATSDVPAPAAHDPVSAVARDAAGAVAPRRREVVGAEVPMGARVGDAAVVTIAARPLPVPAAEVPTAACVLPPAAAGVVAPAGRVVGRVVAPVADAVMRSVVGRVVTRTAAGVASLVGVLGPAAVAPELGSLGWSGAVVAGPSASSTAASGSGAVAVGGERVMARAGPAGGDPGSWSGDGIGGGVPAQPGRDRASPAGGGAGSVGGGYGSAGGRGDRGGAVLGAGVQLAPLALGGAVRERESRPSSLAGRPGRRPG